MKDCDGHQLLPVCDSEASQIVGQTRRKKDYWDIDGYSIIYNIITNHNITVYLYVHVSATAGTLNITIMMGVHPLLTCSGDHIYQRILLGLTWTWFSTAAFLDILLQSDILALLRFRSDKYTFCF